MSDTLYLKHILHDQIEPKQFWLEQLASWDMDEAGNTPEEQFNLILEPVSMYEYVMQQIENGAEIRVSNKEYGKGVITQVYTECPDNILVDILFEDNRELCDISLGEVLGQYWEIL